MLERTTTDLLERLGLDGRLKREAMVEHGFNMVVDGRIIRVDLTDLVDRQVFVYGQTEVTRDLMDAAGERGLEVVYSADASRSTMSKARPYVTFTRDGRQERIDARFIGGMRRLSWAIAPGRAGPCRPQFRARLSVRLAGHPGRCAALPWRARLRQP